ncbi:glycosyltransferase [Sanguibacter suarezii]|uniref:glycosyltransferase n=1 Tax=Sanguibacter suarezii TaxID=60921 RepID=UPI00146FFBF9|nr:glycosyltransferase [Sanguibacter suarezii]
MLKDEPSVAVWVAANGLYPVDALGWDETTSRFRLLYVGRMEPAKKPELLLDGFERALRHLPEEVRLTFVGGGSLAERIESSSHQRGISTRVDTLGHIADYDVLKQLYSEAFASASPGYAGLSLTQSLGFGVPMIVADREPHAPEIELMNKDVGVHFREDDSESLSRAIVELWRTRAAWNHTGIVESVARSYSSTAMAQGFFSALQDDPKGRL